MPNVPNQHDMDAIKITWSLLYHVLKVLHIKIYRIPESSLFNILLYVLVLSSNVWLER